MSEVDRGFISDKIMPDFIHKTVPSHMVALGVDSVKMLAAAYPVISDLEKYPERANLFAFRSNLGEACRLCIAGYLNRHRRTEH